MVDPVAGEGGAQRLGDVLLPDHLGEGLGPVAAVERERGVHVRTLTTGSDITQVTRPNRDHRPTRRSNVGAEAWREPSKRPPTYPIELTYPCCLPALGELGEIPPRGGLPTTLEDGVAQPHISVTHERRSIM
ncbi:hypothetical protein GCM10022237_22810 [Nocardioides ginsengisoli]